MTASLPTQPEHTALPVPACLDRFGRLAWTEARSPLIGTTSKIKSPGAHAQIVAQIGALVLLATPGRTPHPWHPARRR